MAERDQEYPRKTSIARFVARLEIARQARGCPLARKLQSLRAESEDKLGWDLA